MNITVIQSIHVWLSQTNTWLYNQVRYLPDSVEAHVSCERVENLDQFPMRNVHCPASAPFWRRKANSALSRLGLRSTRWFLEAVCRRERASILHSHFGDVAWSNMRPAANAKVKHVATFYGVDMSYMPRTEPIWRQRYQDLFAEVDQVLCEGPHMARGLEELGCPPSKTQVHHLGVSLEEIEFSPRCWCPGQVLRVLIGASFRQKKGIPWALEALGELQHLVPLEITLIGDAHPEARSQTEKRQILLAIERFKLQDKIRLLGYQPFERLLKEAYRHHFFLSPSITADDGDTEGGAPVTIIEMAASGMPVISTRHCDIPEVFPPEQRHRLSPERDVAGLLAAFKTWLDDPGHWSVDLEACRRHVEIEYDARRQGHRLAETYLRLLQT